MPHDEGKEEGTEVLTDEQLPFIIPECCREGWESCPHTVKRERPRRGNIAV
jgi:hypothetical protein